MRRLPLLFVLAGCWHSPAPTAPAAATEDLCPQAAEDVDGFEDRDGCPDPDNDRDRIDDAHDTCRDDAEIYNGFLDDDGCPDPIVLDYDSFTDNLFVLEPITFAKGSATLANYDFVTRLGNWILSEPEIELFAIIGHVEPGEPAQLGLARASAVSDALLSTGVSRTRLSVHDAGTRPAQEWSHTKRPAGADRSVHFRFFKLAGTTIYRWNGTIDERVP